MQVEHQQRLLRRSCRGVTLVEILAVVVIVAIVTAIVWVAVAGRVKGAAKQTVLKSDMRQIVTAVNLYRGDNDGGLPSAWRDFGYFTVIKKGAYGDGYPLVDTVSDRYPSYDVSYHTPECAEPPKANIAFLLFQQSVDRFESRPRANRLDVDWDQAVIFRPACLPNSRAKYPLRIMQRGVIVTTETEGYRVLGANLSGTLSYQHDPGWFVEAAVGF